MPAPTLRSTTDNEEPVLPTRENLDEPPSASLLSASPEPAEGRKHSHVNCISRGSWDYFASERWVLQAVKRAMRSPG